jgi:hypothetical protein
MSYKQEYEYFYNKYYYHFERLVKSFLLAKKNKKENKIRVFNELRNYLSVEFLNKISLTTNPYLKNYLSIFEKRSTFYEEDAINLIFVNKIKPSFDKVELTNLPVDYTLRKLLIEIALVNITNEISRLLQSNSNLFYLFYQLDDFTDFEIKDYVGISVEDTAIYKSLNVRLYPDFYTNRIFEDAIDQEDLQNANFVGHSLPIVVALLNEIGFFELDKIKNLSPNNQAKIIALLQQKDSNDKNLIRSISGNIRVLSPDNKEDNFKYTSHKHSDRVKAVLNDIKLGNK